MQSGERKKEEADMLKGNVLLTGGAGTLGRAIIKRGHEEGWDCRFTIFSTDAIKHHFVQSLYPDVRAVVGDIRDFSMLSNVMVGMDVVIHAAAVKHIPVSEYNVVDTYQINVDGSHNVAQAAVQNQVPTLLAISTDKAAHPANAYGATKMLMEKMIQEFSRYKFKTKFHLVRYGNVLESTGSVVEAWHKSIEADQPIKMTDPKMTRFWLSPSQAVDLVLKSMELESGEIYVAKMPALSIGKLAKFTVGVGEPHTVGDWPIETIPLRPGEKMHETLLTIEETAYAVEHEDHFVLRPSTSQRNPSSGEQYDLPEPYTSDKPVRWLDVSELREMLRNG
jgi:UDP-N-acetylglucosamine 4,6-dehydratase